MTHPTFLNLMAALMLLISSTACKTNQNASANDNNQSSPSDTLVVYDTVYVNNQNVLPQKQILISANKANVIYVGVKNSVDITAIGIASEKLSLSATGAGAIAEKKNSHTYDITPTSPGICKITVESPDLIATAEFRAKRIPDPIARLSNSSGGPMGSGEFKAQGGIMAFLADFEMAATCTVTSYNLIYIAKRQDQVEVVNQGARYVSAARSLVNRAKPGDIYIFDNVRAKCPGDLSSRKINSMVFFIK